SDRASIASPYVYRVLAGPRPRVSRKPGHFSPTADRRDRIGRDTPRRKYGTLTRAASGDTLQAGRGVAHRGDFGGRVVRTARDRASTRTVRSGPRGLSATSCVRARPSSQDTWTKVSSFFCARDGPTMAVPTRDGRERDGGNLALGRIRGVHCGHARGGPGRA